MGAADFAAIAALLSTLSVISSENYLSTLTFLNARDAVIQEQWPVNSGSLTVPHVSSPIKVRNALRSASSDTADRSLSLCITGQNLDMDVLDSFLTTFNSTIKPRLYIIFTAGSASSQETQANIRRLISIAPGMIAAYMEIEVDELPGLMNTDDEILLLQRDLCMQAITHYTKSRDSIFLAVDLVSATPTTFAPIHIASQDNEWHLVTGHSRYSAHANMMGSQTVHLSVRNEVRFRGALGPQMVSDAFGSWQVERLRLGQSAIGGYVNGIAGQLARLWSLARDGEFLKMSGTANKTYALAVRILYNRLKFEQDLNEVVRVVDFSLSHKQSSTSSRLTPLQRARCAAYELRVLENAVTVLVDDRGERRRKKGMIGRLQLTKLKTFEECDRIASSGAPLQLCEPQSIPTFTMRSPYGEQPQACPYCNVVPLFAKSGHCIAGGTVSLRHRRTYASFSDYGVYPKGFDSYDMFSLMEGTVEGDQAAAAQLQPSKHNPVDLPDEDKVRIMPTLVPVRLKKAK